MQARGQNNNWIQENFNISGEAVSQTCQDYMFKWHYKIK